MRDEPVWDLVVVGAGSAGCVVASRVAEDERVRVLLLEAGPDYPDERGLPDDLRNGNDNSYVAHDWGFTYAPGGPAPEQPFPRGKVVGGSSAVNTCIALRGEPDDYDEWARLAGDEWAWTRCLPAFLRLETDRDFGDRPYHGDAGPVPIGRYGEDELQPIQAAFLAGARECGFPACSDHNAPGATGAGPTPMNKRGASRVSMASAYLNPARARPNLAIRSGALVRRVRVEGGEVRGVELDGGATDVVRARRVVVSAGAIMTPPLLVRSGIGPAGVLSRLAIEPVSLREGVGARLLDHPASAVLLRAKPGVVDPGGPLMQACMRWTSEEQNDLFVEPMSFVPWFGRDPSFVAIAAAVYRSRGSGRLLIDSADPAAPPRIETRFFEDGEDVDALVAGLRIADAIARSPSVGEVVDEVVAPLPDVLSDDDRIRGHVRRFCGSGYHPCGTAAMGRHDDPMAVVDARCRVIGVRGLYVVDASVMPDVPRANINIPTVMLAERAAEFVREELA